MTTEAMRAQLDDFVLGTRLDAFRQCTVPPGPPATPLRVNLHCHTFYSYNGYGASPSRIALTAAEQGWYAAGICDFDVLDGLDEFLAAGDLLGLRATVNLETRVFFREYAHCDINSPGEPGVYYFMGAGFVRPPAPTSTADAQLAMMRKGAEARNRRVVELVNAFLGQVQLDYDQDVRPLTPAGNATERHVCTAYYTKGQQMLGDVTGQARFWAAKLGTDAGKMTAILADPMAFNDLARGKLMKTGGPGYIAPTRESFPPLEDVLKMIRDCDAIPMATWLDGISPGEARLQEQLECLMAKGVAALNIIPDRNWNLKAPKAAALKIAKLYECVAVAEQLQLPVNVGTELNKYGQPWCDDFVAAPMQPVAASFIRGAQIMVGHTRLLRFARFSYCGAKAAAEFGSNAMAKNAVFAAVGALPSPSPVVLERLLAGTPERNYSVLRDAARRGDWG